MTTGSQFFNPEGGSQNMWLINFMTRDDFPILPVDFMLWPTYVTLCTPACCQPPGLKSGDSRSLASRHTSAAGSNRDPSNWLWVMDCERACQTKTKREITMSSVMRVGEGSFGFQRRPTRSLKQKIFQKTFFDSLRCCTPCDKPS